MCSTDDAKKLLAVADKARELGQAAIAEARTLINAILTDEQLNNMSPDDARTVLKMTVRSLNQADQQIAQLSPGCTDPNCNNR